MASILFPDAASLRLALASGAVPSEIAAAPVRHGADAAGRIWLEAAAALPRTAVAALRRLGALVQGSSAAALTSDAPNWFCVLPLVPSPTASGDAVLFALPRSESLLPLIGECRRLGAGGIAFRILESGGDTRALLHVPNAPLISLLRSAENAIDSPRAFVQRAPRVWVEWGFDHPLADRIAPPPGQRALLRSPLGCEYVEDWAPGADPTPLPIEPTTIDPEGTADWPLAIDLSLIRSRETPPAELWILRDWQLSQLQALVDQSDDRLLSKLSLAVAELDGSSVAVLRTSPLRDTPLVLMLDGAEQYRPLWRLPNLYVPCGMSLSPPLRRDAIRARLAPEPDRLVWLVRGEQNVAVAQSLPMSAFQPLSACIKYGVERRPLPCAIADAPPVLPVSPYSIRAARAVAAPRRSAASMPQPVSSPRSAGWMEKLVRWVTPLFAQPEDKQTEPQLPDLPETPGTSRPAAHASDERRRALESQLLVADAREKIDASLWPELAGICAAQGQYGEAAHCWLHALWTDEEPQRWARGWLSAEARSNRPESELENWLTSPAQPESIRALAAFVVWAAGQPSHSTIGPALARIQALIDSHEHWLPVRAAWLTRGALSRLAGDDAIGLMACRDRLLDRLFRAGLSAELDVPAFIRFAGQVSGERRREVRDWLVRLREPIHAWIAQPMATGAHELRLPQFGLGAIPRFNRAYVDLMLAWGLARLGERSHSAELVVQARTGLDLGDPVHAFLADAFGFRLDQAIAGLTPAGPLSPTLLARLKELQSRERTDESHRERQAVFKIERMRQASRILEPEERIRAYEEGHLERDELRSITDQNQLAERLSELLAGPTEQLAQSLAIVLDLAPRVGESFAGGALERLVAAAAHWESAPDSPAIDAELAALERGWFVATRYDRSDIVRQLAVELGRILDLHSAAATDDQPSEDALQSLVYQCLRGLRRVGLRTESDQLIDLLQRWSGPPGASTTAAVRRRLLHSAGLAYFGRNPAGSSAYKDARQALFSRRLSPRERTKLACSYFTSLGHGSEPSAFARIEEVFQSLPAVTDQLSTNSHFSLARLRVVEAAIFAVVNDDFALGPAVRRWLDDDEYNVRRRIFRDTANYARLT